MRNGRGASMGRFRQAGALRNGGGRQFAFAQPGEVLVANRVGMAAVGHGGHMRCVAIWTWRSGWDSNPRKTCAFGGFQDLCLKPLGHRSILLRPKSTPGAKWAQNLTHASSISFSFQAVATALILKFQDRCIQPLCHRSVSICAAKWQAGADLAQIFSASFSNFRLLTRKSDYFQGRAQPRGHRVKAFSRLAASQRFVRYAGFIASNFNTSTRGSNIRGYRDISHG